MSHCVKYGICPIILAMTPIRVRIRELRKALGLTQQALGEHADVTQDTISKLESGRQTRVDFATLDRLALALGVEPGELLEREGKRKRR